MHWKTEMTFVMKVMQVVIYSTVFDKHILNLSKLLTF